MNGKTEKEPETAVPSYAEKLGTRIARVADLIGGKRTLANKADIKESQLYRYIRGENIPAANVMVDIASAGKVWIHWLATGEGPMKLGDQQIQETAEHYGQAPSADAAILQEVITGVEEYLEKQGLQLPPDKKGELISLLYDYFQAQGRVERSATERFLKLVIDKK